MLHVIQRRPTALFVVVALFVIGLIMAVVGRIAPTASAAPGARPPGRVVVVGSTDACGPARQFYVGTDGSSYLLPWCGEGAGANAVHYEDATSGNPLWLRGPHLDIVDDVKPPKPTPTPTPTTASPTPTPSPSAVAEKAPVLALDGDDPATASTVKLKWTEPVARAGETVASYVVQQRVNTAVPGAWTTSPDSPVIVRYVTASGLAADTRYDFRVRVEYVSGEDGPWSLAVTAQTDAEAAATPAT